MEVNFGVHLSPWHLKSVSGIVNGLDAWSDSEASSKHDNDDNESDVMEVENNSGSEEEDIEPVSLSRTFNLINTRNTVVSADSETGSYYLLDVKFMS